MLAVGLVTWKIMTLPSDIVPVAEDDTSNTSHRDTGRDPIHLILLWFLLPKWRVKMLQHSPKRRVP
jgi:hypothetical protein